MRSDDRQAAYSGLFACGSIHACARCSAKVRHRRSLEVEEAARRWEAAGGIVTMVTLTTRHRAGMDLGELWDHLQAAWRRCVSGKRAAADAARLGGPLDGKLAMIRAWEVTYGHNGWHPHLHVLVFSRKPLDKRYAERLWSTWYGYFDGRGLPTPTRRHGLVLSASSSAAASYVAKVQEPKAAALELTRLDLKRARGGGLVPFALLDLVAAGDRRATGAWREWERASKGRRAMFWSHGLRDALIPDLGKLTDEQIAGEAPEAATDGREWYVVANFTGPTWATICRRRLEVPLLEAAEDAGGIGVRQLLDREGFAPEAADAPP